MIPRRARPWFPVLGVILSTLVVAGCLSRAAGTVPTSWQFVNRTDVPVTVTWVREDGEQLQVAIIEGNGARSVDIDKFGDAREICDEGAFVVTDAYGEEIARRPMTCDPWIIEAD